MTAAPVWLGTTSTTGCIKTVTGPANLTTGALTNINTGEILTGLDFDF